MKLAVALWFAGIVFAQADKAVPRPDQNSQIAHQQLLEKAKRGGIDVYFVGDSITRRWGALDYPTLLENWRKNFFGWNAGNFGWGADRVEHILWRLENGELEGVNPKVIVFQAGTNNAPNDSAESITRGIEAALRTMRAKAPRATIILTAIFPRGDNPRASQTILAVNASLPKLADGKTVRFLNVNKGLVGPDNLFLPGMMNPDKLHPAAPGYQVWADGLRPILTELLGPPASMDHAPPPTGDPSATRPKQ